MKEKKKIVELFNMNKSLTPEAFIAHLQKPGYKFKKLVRKGSIGEVTFIRP